MSAAGAWRGAEGGGEGGGGVTGGRVARRGGAEALRRRGAEREAQVGARRRPPRDDEARGRAEVARGVLRRDVALIRRRERRRRRSQGAPVDVGHEGADREAQSDG